MDPIRIDVSPLRGFVVPVTIDPMAYAMGYRSIAAPRLRFGISINPMANIISLSVS